MPREWARGLVVLNGAPYSLAELPGYFGTLDRSELASGWIACVLDAVSREERVELSHLGRALLVVAERLSGEAGITVQETTPQGWMYLGALVRELGRRGVDLKYRTLAAMARRGELPVAGMAGKRRVYDPDAAEAALRARIANRCKRA